MTIVVHLKNGRRMQREGEPTPRICVPTFIGPPDHPTSPWRFGQEFYRLVDIRDVGCGPVATYVYEEPEPIVVEHVLTDEEAERLRQRWFEKYRGVPGAGDVWERMARWWREFWGEARETDRNDQRRG